MTILVKIIIILALNTTICISKFTLCNIIHHLLSFDFWFKTYSIKELEYKLTIWWFCYIRCTFRAWAETIIFLTSNNSFDTFIIEKLKSFSTSLTWWTISNYTSVQYISFTFIIIKVKSAGAFWTEPIEVMLYTALIIRNFIIWKACSVNIFVITKFACITITIESI